MARAIRSCSKKNGLSATRAAVKFGVSKTTLLRRLRAERRGPPATNPSNCLLLRKKRPSATGEVASMTEDSLRSWLTYLNSQPGS